MKQLLPWLLGFAVGCSGQTGEDFIEHHPGDAGLADADADPVVPSGARPLPIAGGGLAIDPGRGRAVVSDPDRRRILLVQLDPPRILARHADADGAGRIALADDRAYVALAGAIAVIDLDDGSWRDTFDVCPGPRGLDVHGPWLYVACLGGVLTRIDRFTGRIDRRIPLAPDLQDVLVVGGRPWVTRFRDAEILIVDDALVRRLPRLRRVVDGTEWQGRVGWRLRRLPDGRIGLLHQWHREGPTPPSYGRPGADCRAGLVVPGMTLYAPDAPERLIEGAAPDGYEPLDPRPAALSRALGGAALIVDFAIDGGTLGLATPGEAHHRDPFANPERPGARDDRPLRSLSLDRFEHGPADDCAPLTAGGEGRHRPVAVAGWTHAGRDHMLYHSPETGLAWLSPGEERPAPPALGGDAIGDTGHRLFHVDPGGGITCANCHPRGGDDGHTWHLDGIGPRRSQPLHGGLSDRAPYHWDGALADAGELFSEIRGRRMGGDPLSPAGVEAFVEWLDGLRAPAHAPLVALEAISRGRRDFTDLGCDACHVPPRYTDDGAHDVATGGVFQTPSLVGVGLRGRLMHDGCTDDIERGFAVCGGHHAELLARLSPERLADLIAFLSTL